MIHTFVIDNTNFLYDVESQSLFEVDKLIVDLVNNSPTLLTDYDVNDVKIAKQEISELVSSDLLQAKAPDVDSVSISNGLIKSLCMHMSHDCNLRCKYCFAGTGTYHGERMHMSQEVAYKTVDFLIANSGNRRNLEIDFFGGEPLMNFEVMRNTVAYCREMEKKHNKIFKLTCTTNGVLLNKEISQYLNEEMDNVVLSLDGRPEVNDAQRPTINGKGSYDLIMDNYKYFRSIRGDKSYYLRGTFTFNNLDFDVDALHMADAGFDQVSIEPVVLPAEHPLALHYEDIDTINASYERLAVEYVNRRLDKDKWFSFFHFMVDLEGGPCFKKRLVGCGAGDEYLAVTPDGSLYPCHQFAGEKEYLLGDVYDGLTNAAVRASITSSNINTKPDCKNCWAKYHCSGGCIANAIHYNGDINKPYALACDMMKKRLECALYVYSKEKQKNN